MFIHMLCNTSYMHQMQKVLGSWGGERPKCCVAFLFYSLFSVLFPEKEITVLATSSKTRSHL